MPGPGPAVAAVRLAVRAAVADLPPWSQVLVACSGGADSLALAAAAAFEGPRTGVRIGAVIVDHGLQDGSAEVAARAADQCRALGLDPVDVVRVDVPDSPAGPEEAARTARYAALADAATRHTAAVVLLGHTRDDQAEQVLLGLARGSGARSLSGMPPTRGGYVRPLLGVSRRFARTRARRAVADLERDLGPGLTAALARSADLLRDDADLLDELAGQARAGLAAGEEPPESSSSAEPSTGGRAQGDVRVSVHAVAALPAALRRRVWRILAAEAGARAVSAVHVESLDALVMAWRGQGTVDLPGGVVCERVAGSIRLGRRR